MKDMERIKPYDRNAKIHTDGQLRQLARIVKEVGWRQPVVVNQSGVIVIGHGRYFAYQKYGDEYGLEPVWIIDDVGKAVFGRPASMPMTEEQERAYRLADNKLNESEWSMGLAVADLKLMSPEALVLTGFTMDDIEAFESVSEISQLSREREIDLGKYNVATVEAPETPRFRARQSFYFDSVEEFERVKKFFDAEGGVLETEKLLSLMKK